MEITLRAFVTIVHGMLFGGFFLLAIYGLVVERFRSACFERNPGITPRGISLERFYLFSMATLGWAAVLTGAYIIYPWYRAVPPAGSTSLALYPKFVLMSSPTTRGWHTLGMEWKEHVAWIAPMVMTMVAYVMTTYQRSMHEHPQIRRAVLVFVLTALGAAGVAGMFGAMLNKYAPVNGGSTIHLAEKTQ
jgi:hypothetical protein